MVYSYLNCKVCAAPRAFIRSGMCTGWARHAYSLGDLASAHTAPGHDSSAPPSDHVRALLGNWAADIPALSLDDAVLPFERGQLSFGTGIKVRQETFCTVYFA